MKLRMLFFSLVLLARSGSLFAQAPFNVESTTNGLTQHWSSGAAINRGQIVKLDASGRVVPMALTDTSGAIGIAATAAGSAGVDVIVSVTGSPLTQMDGACTVGAGNANIVQISSTVAGAGHCVSVASGQTIGTAVGNLAAAGFVNVQMSPLSSASGSSGSASNPAPNMGFYLTNACTTANTNQCFFTNADTLEFNDCNWTAAAPDVNCTAGHFASTDCVGGAGCTGTGTSKSVMGAQSCADDNQGSGSGGQIATTTGVTIASFISATHITLSATPANAVASNGCLIFGHLDDTGAAAVDTAVQAASSCPKLFLAATYYYWASPHFNTNPGSCAALGPGQGSFGTTALTAGFEIDGRGAGPTTIFLDTKFPNGDPCTSKATSGQGTGGCFAIPLMGKWIDFHFDGGNQTTAPNLNNKTLITMAVAKLQNFTCTNMGWQNTTMVGLNLGLLAQLDQVNNAGCGGIGMQIESNGSSEGHVVGYRVVVENSITNALYVRAPGAGGVASFTCYWCLFAMPVSGASSTSVIRNDGGTLRLYGGNVQPSNAFSSTNTSVTGYRCQAANGTLYADGVYFMFTTAVGGSSHNALWNGATGCAIYLVNSLITASATTSNAFSDFGSTSGTKLLSLGGTSFSGAANVSAGMNVNFAPTDNLSALTGFSPTCAATTGGTACSVLAGGTNEKGTVRITASAVATGTVTLTFLGTYSGPTGAAPRCQFNYVNAGGTGAWSLTTTTPIVLTTRSTTAPVFNWNQTAALTAGSTYDIDYVCPAM